MPIVKHDQLPWTETRPGVQWRFIAGRATGDPDERIRPGLTMFHQAFEPGYGVPRHLHELGDEILTVLEGEAEVLLDGEARSATVGASIVVPAGTVHSFRNAGPGRLLVQCVLNVDAMRAEFLEDPQGVPAAY
ncbi:MAG: cupin domain-containing protein [Chloroflexota bacterium]